MTIDKDRFVKIPIWLVSIVLPLLIAAFAGFVTDQVMSAGDRKQIEVNTKRLDYIPYQLENKVDRREFEIFKDQLNRIEDKLDNHMSNIKVN